MSRQESGRVWKSTPVESLLCAWRFLHRRAITARATPTGRRRQRNGRPATSGGPAAATEAKSESDDGVEEFFATAAENEWSDEQLRDVLSMVDVCRDTDDCSSQRCAECEHIQKVAEEYGYYDVL